MITVDQIDHIAVLTLDRPAKLNALTLEMVARLHALSAEFAADDSVRAVVITGAGERAFSVGGDLDSLLPAALEAGRDVLNPDPTRRFFSDLYKPVIAAVNGLCLGGGLELLLGTDIRISSGAARFGLPEPTLGLIPGAGTTVRLHRQIPWAVAMEMLLVGASIDAARAYACGLVNEVRDGDVLERAMELARRVAAHGPVAIQKAKESAVRSLGLGPAFAVEHDLNSTVLSSADARAGVAAFHRRQQPVFTGR